LVIPDSTHASRANADELARIATLVAAHATLEDVTRWALSRVPARVFTKARSAAEGGVVEGKGPGSRPVRNRRWIPTAPIPGPSPAGR
jgi:hypothetical protein